MEKWNIRYLIMYLKNGILIEKTTDICGNDVWKGGVLHISGYIVIDDSYPEYVKHARDLISTWWEFDFWELSDLESDIKS